MRAIRGWTTARSNTVLGPLCSPHHLNNLQGVALPSGLHSQVTASQVDRGQHGQRSPCVCRALSPLPGPMEHWDGDHGGLPTGPSPPHTVSRQKVLEPTKEMASCRS